jgi:transcriptional regulator with XRE-family HTH domain
MKTKLQYLREYLLLNQSAFSMAIGISQSALSCYERGRRQIGIKTIRHMIQTISNLYHIELTADDFITNIYIDQEFIDYLHNNVTNA